MNFQTTTLLLSTVVGLSAGNILFKFTAISWEAADTPASPRVIIFLSFALLVYSIATLAWISVLRNTPINEAYPFMALSFVIVPILSAVFFGEVITLKYMFGVLLIIIGVVMTTRA